MTKVQLLPLIAGQPEYPPEPTPADEARAQRNWDDMAPSRKALIRRMEKKSAAMAQAAAKK